MQKEFTFTDLFSVLDYLHALGVQTIYASPVFKAVSGTTHGYDGLDPNEINPGIGDLSDLRRISSKLKEKGMGWLQDVVPNHMAFHPANNWLMDVLEKGEQSLYKKYFDCTGGKIMVPFLGCSADEALEKNELQIAWKENRLVFTYFDSAWPLNPGSHRQVLRACTSDNKFSAAADKISSLPDYSVSWEKTKTDLASMFAEIPVDMSSVNHNKELLKDILEQQHYRLCHWQETDRRINYRRFFTVNGLICMNMQEPEVFQCYHQLITKLVRGNIFQGLRVDHIDGLYDPALYLQWLREIAGEETYVVVEKILADEEELPASWPVDGNTGYDFLAVINRLFACPSAEESLTRFYHAVANDQPAYDEQVRKKKSFILFNHMQGELDNLLHLFQELKLATDQELESLSSESLRTVIAGLLINLPVYRFYGRSFPLESRERNRLTDVFRMVKQQHSEHILSAELLERILLDTKDHLDDSRQERLSHFYKRLMQFSGPLMAKGVEDTLMYTFNRLLSRNEVGDDPGIFGITIREFHRRMIERRERWSYSLNATATHDTKRGEDARARLNVLTGIPDVWIKTAGEWMKMNPGLKKNGMPDSNDEYFIYQSLLGAYPLEEDEEKGFAERFTAYLQKAFRESKVNSNWTSPDEAYEEGVRKFALALLDRARPFWKSFSAFLASVIDHGIMNSLVQVIVKFTAPGIPDVYQGCELWDFSFVDPDNRRPVDYDKRKRLLEEVKSISPRELWNTRKDGRIKLWLTTYLAHLRKSYAGVFTAGEYQPLEVQGDGTDHILAFARKHHDTCVIMVLPLHTAAMTCNDMCLYDWKDTKVVLPSGGAGICKSLLTGTEILHDRHLAVSELFNELPFAILERKINPKERGAGILLHISSLPSAYGIGDFGPAAKEFVDFLSRAGQSAWQILPLNPTGEEQSYSPYSSCSSMAGNPLFVSPDLLVANGWLDSSELENKRFPVSSKIDYRKVEMLKEEIFEMAWSNFQLADRSGFIRFCDKEKEWLDDFALFMLLKKRYGHKPWNLWPEEWKNRKKGSLDKLRPESKMELDYIRWQQYLFHLQWNELKEYANRKGISIIGDLPFYISYDSADVWTNREIFALDPDGNMQSVAGVPPDAFTADGQLWGMPVFNWQKLHETGYAWWLQRISKNIQWFDAVRLDHFRAFSAYWEVAGNEITARNGRWISAPGKELFNAIKKATGSLPFIAEDLGDIDDAVRELRKGLGLPGMKVLQFAFGDDFGMSEFMPHNHTKDFVVYTGTHDNNTIKGWWKDEADEMTKQRVKDYAGYLIDQDNVANYFCRLAYASTASQAIIPLQDLLDLGSDARMNRPSSVNGNWSWRLMPEHISRQLERKLRKWTRIYNR